MRVRIVRLSYGRTCRHEPVASLKPGFEARSSFPRKREAMFTRPKWIPAFAGMTSFRRRMS